MATAQGPKSNQNESIARSLDEVADLLSFQKANPFRVRAYRRAARTVRGISDPLGKVYHQGGIEALRKLPDIGEGLARAIATLIRTGHLPVLDRLRGEIDPLPLFCSVPGIGPTLARRLSEELGIHNLEDLEAASYDSRLAAIGGFGRKRIEGIRSALQCRLGKGFTTTPKVAARPSVEDLLEIDRIYRQRSRNGELPRIAPRRFNPGGQAWLPILHITRNKLHYTALYSNTAKAHELGMTRDWVVIYHDGALPEGQHTVVTARRGPLAGRRIVAGREEECLAFYEKYKKSSPGRKLKSSAALAQSACEPAL